MAKEIQVFIVSIIVYIITISVCIWTNISYRDSIDSCDIDIYSHIICNHQLFFMILTVDLYRLSVYNNRIWEICDESTLHKSYHTLLFIYCINDFLIAAKIVGTGVICGAMPSKYIFYPIVGISLVSLGLSIFLLILLIRQYFKPIVSKIKIKYCSRRVYLPFIVIHNDKLGIDGKKMEDDDRIRKNIIGEGFRMQRPHVGLLYNDNMINFQDKEEENKQHQGSKDIDNGSIKGIDHRFLCRVCDDIPIGDASIDDNIHNISGKVKREELLTMPCCKNTIHKYCAFRLLVGRNNCGICEFHLTNYFKSNKSLCHKLVH